MEIINQANLMGFGSRIITENLQQRIDEERFKQTKTDQYNVYLNPDSYRSWERDILLENRPKIGYPRSDTTFDLSKICYKKCSVVGTE